MDESGSGLFEDEKTEGSSLDSPFYTSLPDAMDYISLDSDYGQHQQTLHYYQSFPCPGSGSSSSSSSYYIPPSRRSERIVVLEPRNEVPSSVPSAIVQPFNTKLMSYESEKKATPQELQRRQMESACDYFRRLQEEHKKYYNNNKGPALKAPAPLPPTPKRVPPSSLPRNHEIRPYSYGIATPFSLDSKVLSEHPGSFSPKCKPNIDLGAVVESTIVAPETSIITPISKTFTQHWILVAEETRVLLLDFESSFSLLIPNVENGKTFRSNESTVEVQTKSTATGQKLTFMKFRFENPKMDIVAPVLDDKGLGIKVLRKNSAVVFLGQVLETESKGISFSSSLPTLPLLDSLPPSPSKINKHRVYVSQLEPMYPRLRDHELVKILECRYCKKRFSFLSEHLRHLKAHTTDVEKVVEMSMQIWVSDRKLKCELCKKRATYTLDYARHKDSHGIPGLSCNICEAFVETPADYGAHLETFHSSFLFSSSSSSSSSVSQHKETPSHYSSSTSQNKVSFENEAWGVEDTQLLDSFLDEAESVTKTIKVLDSVDSGISEHFSPSSSRLSSSLFLNEAMTDEGISRHVKESSDDDDEDLMKALETYSDDILSEPLHPPKPSLEPMDIMTHHDLLGENSLMDDLTFPVMALDDLMTRDSSIESLKKKKNEPLTNMTSTNEEKSSSSSSSSLSSSYSSEIKNTPLKSEISPSFPFPHKIPPFSKESSSSSLSSSSSSSSSFSSSSICTTTTTTTTTNTNNMVRATKTSLLNSKSISLSKNSISSVSEFSQLLQNPIKCCQKEKEINTTNSSVEPSSKSLIIIGSKETSNSSSLSSQKYSSPLVDSSSINTQSSSELSLEKEKEKMKRNERKKRKRDKKERKKEQKRESEEKRHSREKTLKTHKRSIKESSVRSLLSQVSYFDVLNEKSVSFKCEGCGTEFVTSNSLTIHRVNCMEREIDDVQRHECPFCKDRFMSANSLSMHTSLCRKIKEKQEKNILFSSPAKLGTLKLKLKVQRSLNDVKKKGSSGVKNNEKEEKSGNYSSSPSLSLSSVTHPSSSSSPHPLKLKIKIRGNHLLSPSPPSHSTQAPKIPKLVIKKDNYEFGETIEKKQIRTRRSVYSKRFWIPNTCTSDLRESLRRRRRRRQKGDREEEEEGEEEERTTIKSISSLLSTLQLLNCKVKLLSLSSLLREDDRKGRSKKRDQNLKESREEEKRGFCVKLRSEDFRLLRNKSNSKKKRSGRVKEDDEVVALYSSSSPSSSSVPLIVPPLKLKLNSEALQLKKPSSSHYSSVAGCRLSSLLQSLPSNFVSETPSLTSFQIPRCLENAEEIQRHFLFSKDETSPQKVPPLRLHIKSHRMPPSQRHFFDKSEISISNDKIERKPPPFLCVPKHKETTPSSSPTSHHTLSNPLYFAVKSSPLRKKDETTKSMDFIWRDLLQNVILTSLQKSQEVMKRKSVTQLSTHLVVAKKSRVHLCESEESSLPIANNNNDDLSSFLISKGRHDSASKALTSSWSKGSENEKSLSCNEKKRTNSSCRNNERLYENLVEKRKRKKKNENDDDLMTTSETQNSRKAQEKKKKKKKSRENNEREEEERRSTARKEEEEEDIKSIESSSSSSSLCFLQRIKEEKNKSCDFRLTQRPESSLSEISCKGDSRGQKDFENLGLENKKGEENHLPTGKEKIQNVEEATPSSINEKQMKILEKREDDNETYKKKDSFSLRAQNKISSEQQQQQQENYSRNEYNNEGLLKNKEKRSQNIYEVTYSDDNEEKSQILIHDHPMFLYGISDNDKGIKEKPDENENSFESKKSLRVQEENSNENYKINSLDDSTDNDLELEAEHRGKDDNLCEFKEDDTFKINKEVFCQVSKTEEDNLVCNIKEDNFYKIKEKTTIIIGEDYVWDVLKKSVIKEDFSSAILEITEINKEDYPCDVEEKLKTLKDTGRYVEEISNIHEETSCQSKETSFEMEQRSEIDDKETSDIHKDTLIRAIETSLEIEQRSKNNKDTLYNVEETFKTHKDTTCNVDFHKDTSCQDKKMSSAKEQRSEINEDNTYDVEETFKIQKQYLNKVLKNSSKIKHKSDIDEHDNNVCKVNETSKIHIDTSCQIKKTLSDMETASPIPKDILIDSVKTYVMDKEKNHNLDNVVPEMKQISEIEKDDFYKIKKEMYIIQKGTAWEETESSNIHENDSCHVTDSLSEIKQTYEINQVSGCDVKETFLIIENISCEDKKMSSKMKQESEFNKYSTWDAKENSEIHKDITNKVLEKSAENEQKSEIDEDDCIKIYKKTETHKNTPCNVEKTFFIHKETACDTGETSEIIKHNIKLAKGNSSNVKQISEIDNDTAYNVEETSDIHKYTLCQGKEPSFEMEQRSEINKDNEYDVKETSEIHKNNNSNQVKEETLDNLVSEKESSSEIDKDNFYKVNEKIHRIHEDTLIDVKEIPQISNNNSSRCYKTSLEVEQQWKIDNDDSCKIEEKISEIDDNKKYYIMETSEIVGDSSTQVNETLSEMKQENTASNVMKTSVIYENNSCNLNKETLPEMEKNSEIVEDTQYNVVKTSYIYNDPNLCKGNETSDNLVSEMVIDDIQELSELHENTCCQVKETVSEKEQRSEIYENIFYDVKETHDIPENTLCQSKENYSEKNHREEIFKDSECNIKERVEIFTESSIEIDTTSEKYKDSPLVEPFEESQVKSKKVSQNENFSIVKKRENNINTDKKEKHDESFLSIELLPRAPQVTPLYLTTSKTLNKESLSITSKESKNESPTDFEEEEEKHPEISKDNNSYYKELSLTPGTPNNHSQSFSSHSPSYIDDFFFQNEERNRKSIALCIVTSILSELVYESVKTEEKFSI